MKNSTSKKVLYIVEGEIPEWLEKKDYELYLEFCTISKQTAKKLVDTTIYHMEYHDNKLKKMFSCSELQMPEIFEEKVPLALVDYPYNKIEPNRIYAAVKSNQKECTYLGGGVSPHFEIPQSEFTNPWVKLVTLSNKSEPFSWIPWESIDIINPHFMIYGTLFLDYSNVNNPVLMQAGEKPSYVEQLKSNGIVEYKRLDLNFYDIEKLKKKYIQSDHIYNLCSASVPLWLQHIDIPISPITGSPMKFAIQLYNDDALELERFQVEFENKENDEYLSETKEFIGGGYIYIFVESETKIVALINQGT